MRSGVCYASKKHIGDIIGISKGTVSKIISRLEDSGFIEKLNDGKHLRITDKFDSQSQETIVSKGNDESQKETDSFRKETPTKREEIKEIVKSNKENYIKENFDLFGNHIPINGIDILESNDLKYVKLTKEEASDLVANHGKNFVIRAAEILDNYIKERPRSRANKYKDHNLVIQRWPIEEARKEILSKDPDLIFKTILELANTDRAWWRGVKEKCNLKLFKVDDVKDGVRKWAYHIVLKDREVLKRQEDIVNSLVSWLMNHKNLS